MYSQFFGNYLFSKGHIAKNKAIALKYFYVKFYGEITVLV